MLCLKRYRRYRCQLRMITHPAQPVRGKQTLQRSFMSMQAQNVAEAARLQAIPGKTNADVAGVKLHQCPMQFGVQSAKQVGLGELRIRQ